MKFLRETRSVVALQFSLFIVPLVLSVGGAVDYSRAVHYTAELQGVADSAALAAAMLWQGGTTTAATTAASNYITAGVSKLQSNATVTPTVVTSAPTTGYQVDVTLSANLPTSFLGIIQPTIPVTVYSTALNPNPFGHFCAGAVTATTALCASTATAFSAGAADTNTVYWYIVPADGSMPADSALTQLWTNASGANNNPQPIPLDANQRIGFAMRNTTGNYGQTCTGSGGNRKCTNNTNQYGSTNGTTHTFYSHLVPPSNSSKGYTGVGATNNPNNVNSINGATGNNCSMLVTVNTAITDITTTPPFSGSCPAYNNATATQYAAPTCSQLGSKLITFYFNDLGGTTDDKDFNDAVFTYYCGGNGTGATGSTGASVARSVVLIK